MPSWWNVKAAAEGGATRQDTDTYADTTAYAYAYSHAYSHAHAYAYAYSRCGYGDRL